MKPSEILSDIISTCISIGKIEAKLERELYEVKSLKFSKKAHEDILAHQLGNFDKLFMVQLSGGHVLFKTEGEEDK